MSRLKTTYLHLRWSFCFMKQGWMYSFNLYFSFEYGIVVQRVEKSNVLIHENRDLDCMYSNISLEFFKIHISLSSPLEYLLSSGYMKSCQANCQYPLSLSSSLCNVIYTERRYSCDGSKTGVSQHYSEVVYLLNVWSKIQ